MPSRDEFEAAISAGVIGRTEAERLAAFLVQYRASREVPAETGDDRDDAEAVRFIRGFHDIFLTIGVTLLLVGVAYTTEIVARGIWPYSIAVAAWALAEYFTRMKRLTLPSIALSIAFGIASAYVVSALTGQFDLVSQMVTPARNVPLAYKLPTLGALLGSALFYLRFRLPFTLAQMVTAVAATIAMFIGPGAQQTRPIFMIMGLLIFVLALYFDLRDPHRRTIAADNAFWLHLTAAPLIVHTTIGYVWTGGAANLNLSQAMLTVAVIFTLAFVALVIDRRALLVAGLTYFGAALFIIIRNAAIDENTVVALTILILGGALVLLGAGWRTLRAAVILPTLRPE